MRVRSAVPLQWIAHRGGGRAAPENTLAAFRAGHAAGFRAFECDVRLSADDVPYLLHDDRLERTTDGHGAAARWTWQDLCRLDAGAWLGPRYAGEPLLRLDDVLAFAARRHVWLNLELKAARGEAHRTGAHVAARVAAWLGAHPHAPVPLLSSFSPGALGAAAASLAHTGTRVPLALLGETCTSTLLRQARSLGAEALHLHWRGLVPAQVRAVRATGLALRVYTVNRAATARRLLSLGVDGLFTDRLDLPRRCQGGD